MENYEHPVVPPRSDNPADPRNLLPFEKVIEYPEGHKPTDAVYENKIDFIRLGHRRPEKRGGFSGRS